MSHFLTANVRSVKRKSFGSAWMMMSCFDNIDMDPPYDPPPGNPFNFCNLFVFDINDEILQDKQGNLFLLAIGG